MNQAVTLQVSEMEEKIAGRINPSIANSLVVSDQAGGLAFANVGQVFEMAKLMAISQIAIPKHLRGNPGACIAVCIQAIEWRMSPFAVANKSYSVNDRMAYEAQLIQAVILQRAPIKGRIKAEYSGEGDKRRLRVWAVLREDDEVVDYMSPEFGKILPKNSPLWKNDPDQQLFFSSVRALCRRHFPDVILGVYAKDEIEDSVGIGPDKARDVTPKNLTARLDALADAPAKAKQEAGAPVEFDADTGEIQEEAEASTGSAETSTDEGDQETDEASAGDAEDTLLVKAQVKAMRGVKALNLWLGGLTQAEAQDLAPELPKLKAAAKAAEAVS